MVSLVVIIGGILLIMSDLAKLLVMVSLFLSPPFGTIAYLAIWGFFNRGGAQAILSISMVLKLGFVVMLLMAQQRFVQNRGLVLIIFTSLVANLIVSFLHSFVPGILVSITDAIAAIVVVILAVIWSVAMLIGSIIAIIKAVF